MARRPYVLIALPKLFRINFSNELKSLLPLFSKSQKALSFLIEQQSLNEVGVRVLAEHEAEHEPLRGKADCLSCLTRG